MGRGKQSRGRRAMDGGRPQSGPLTELLRKELRAALLPQPRGVSGTGQVRREEWRCEPCGASNWLDRVACRLCGKAKGSKKGPPRTVPVSKATAGDDDKKDDNEPTIEEGDEKKGKEEKAKTEEGRSHPTKTKFGRARPKTK